MPHLAQAGGMEGRGGAPPIARSSDNLLCSPSRRARFTSCSRAPGALARKADANLRAAGVCLPSDRRCNKLHTATAPVLPLSPSTSPLGRDGVEGPHLHPRVPSGLRGTLLGRHYGKGRTRKLP